MLLDKMSKYEMDGQTERRTDRRKYDVKPVYPAFNFVEAGGIIMSFHVMMELPFTFYVKYKL